MAATLDKVIEEIHAIQNETRSKKRIDADPFLILSAIIRARPRHQRCYYENALKLSPNPS
jgi:hypothetical protein